MRWGAWGLAVRGAGWEPGWVGVAQVGVAWTGGDAWGRRSAGWWGCGGRERKGVRGVALSLCFASGGRAVLEVTWGVECALGV